MCPTKDKAYLKLMPIGQSYPHKFGASNGWVKKRLVRNSNYKRRYTIKLKPTQIDGILVSVLKT